MKPELSLAPVRSEHRPHFLQNPLNVFDLHGFMVVASEIKISPGQRARVANVMRCYALGNNFLRLVHECYQSVEFWRFRIVHWCSEAAPEHPPEKIPRR